MTDLVHRLVWEIDGKRFVSPIAWEVAADADGAALQARHAMENAGLSDLVRFIGLEVCTRKASTSDSRTRDQSAATPVPEQKPKSQDPQTERGSG